MHEHGCEHGEVKYCKVCKVVYCMKCGKEWRDSDIYDYVKKKLCNIPIQEWNK